MLKILMDGNATPLIVDLYLSECEYCYMIKVVKTDCASANLLLYNCRHLDDICTVNLKYFGDIARDVYDNILLLGCCTCSHAQDTFLDLYIRVIDHKFVIGIYYKVDHFNFEVIICPFHKQITPQTDLFDVANIPPPPPPLSVKLDIYDTGGTIHVV